MNQRRITILGGGNTAFSTAAKLTLDGFDITLCELPAFKNQIETIKDTKKISLESVTGSGVANLYNVTTDFSIALSFSNLVLVIVPSYAHSEFINAALPFIDNNHIIVLMPGNLGSIQWKKMALEAGKSCVISEVDTAPYVCRKTSSDSAIIWGVVSQLGIGVLPSIETDQVFNLLQNIFPGLSTYSDVMECGLSAANPVVHPAGVLMNAGRIEYSHGEFYFYEEGVSKSVAEVIMAVDKERINIGKHLDYSLHPINEVFHNAGFGPKGNLWETINGSYMLTRLKAPGNLSSRWLTEDIPFGLVTWSFLANHFNIETPMINSIINLGSVIMEDNPWESGRDITSFGIANKSVDDIKSFLKNGNLN
tara:strand:- start:363 stop:1457 length:1095 start_codon:yes stop_codon:yes gene_type:complete